MKVPPRILLCIAHTVDDKQTIPQAFCVSLPLDDVARGQLLILKLSRHASSLQHASLIPSRQKKVNIYVILVDQLTCLIRQEYKLCMVGLPVL